MTWSTRRMTVLGVASLWLALAPAAGGCGRHEGASGAAGRSMENGEAPPAVPFELRRDSADLSYFWFDGHGAPHPASRLDDVPEANRERVRVEPPRPEQRAPGWVFIADLRAPLADGRFAVHAVASEQFAQELASLSGLASAMAPPAPPPAAAPSALALGAAGPATGATGAARVVVYGASWCGACHQAMDYLRANNIPFIDHDIEREPDAQREMATRAAEQGVPTGSIPIIAVDGRLMVGFNPGRIQQMLRGS